MATERSFVTLRSLHRLKHTPPPLSCDTPVALNLWDACVAKVCASLLNTHAAKVDEVDNNRVTALIWG